jgi:hypothetical protein
MEIEITDSYGWLQYECSLALNLDELTQLRFAMSLAKAHGVEVSIIDTFLALTDGL